MRAQEFIQEMPLPADWDQAAFTQGQSSFKSRLAYAVERAKKLGAGSSRVALSIEFQGRPTALKVAKNSRGLAQNAEEVRWLDDGYIGNLDIVIPLIDYDKAHPQPLWMQTEQATRATEKQLCNIMKCTSLQELVNVAKNIANVQTPSQYYSHSKTLERMRASGKYSEDDLDTFTDYANEVADLLGNTDLEAADLTRASNWGIFNGRPVVIDLGFTESVSNQYYSG